MGQNLTAGMEAPSAGLAGNPSAMGPNMGTPPMMGGGRTPGMGKGGAGMAPPAAATGMPAPPAQAMTPPQAGTAPTAQDQMKKQMAMALMQRLAGSAGQRGMVR